MHVLVVSHTYVIEVNRQKLRALAALRSDLEVTVAVPRKWQPGGVHSGSIRTEASQVGNFRVVPLSNFSQRHQGLLCFDLGIMSLVRELQPDIIQVEQGAKSLAYMQFIGLKRRLGLTAKMVLFTWWNLPYTLRFPLSLIEDYNLTYTDGALVGNADAAAVLRQRGYAGPTAVIPQLGVNVQQFQPQPQPELAAELNLPPEAFVVGYVGRFVPEKGLLTLAAALSGLGDRPWYWLLVGSGPLQAEIESILATARLGDRLRWVNSVLHEAVPRYLNLMQVLVLPSQTTPRWKEQFGHVLIEAMACGVAVVGSSSGEIPNVIGKAGLVFPEGDAEALRDRLLQLMQFPEQTAQLAQAGRQRASAHYTHQTLAQQQLAFYESLL